MGLIDKIKAYFNLPHTPEEETPEFRMKMARHLSGRHVRYVSERIYGSDGNAEDSVIGRDGEININNAGEFIVICGGDILLRCEIQELKAYELLSLEGVVLEAFDLESGKERQIIAYYKYYR